MEGSLQDGESWVGSETSLSASELAAAVRKVKTLPSKKGNRGKIKEWSWVHVSA